MKDQFHNSHDHEYENDFESHSNEELASERATSGTKKSKVVRNPRRSIRDIPIVRKSGSILDITPEEIVEGVKEEIKEDRKHHRADSEYLDVVERDMVRDFQEHHTEDVVIKRKTSRGRGVGVSLADVHGSRAYVRGKKSTDDEAEPAFMASSKTGRSGKKKVFVSLLILVLIVSISLMHTVFAHAKIDIVAPAQNIELSRTELPNLIPYQVVTKNAEEVITVKDIKTVSVNGKASGTVVLYNNFSTSPYELVKTTRLETENGSIYRLLEDVTIPGKKTVNGKEVPGSINAKVEADKAGSQYNAKGGLELRLPGLIKGTAKYVNIYAKTAANFTGGSTGTAPDTKSQAVTQAIEDVKSTSQQNAIQEFKDAHPDLLVLEDSLTTTSSIADSKVVNGVGTFTVRLTTKIIGLSREEIKNGIVTTLDGKKITPFDSSLSDLKYYITDTDGKDLLEGSFKVAVEGTVQAGFSTTLTALASMIAGKDDMTANNIIEREIPGADAKISIWPFWKGTLPASAEAIEIQVK